MRDGWRETQLGDVVAINPEATTGISARKSIRYIDLSSVSRERGIDSSAVNSMAFADAPGRARRVVRSHDVLIATVRPYLRGFAMVSPVWDGEIASTGFAVLRAREGMIRPEFVWACVSTDGFVEHLMQRATGSNYPAIRPGDIASYPIHLPPLSEQRRIVDLIATLDENIGAAEAVKTRARACRRAIVASLLGEPGSEWRSARLDDLVEVLDRLRKPVNAEERERRQGSVPYYGATGQAGWIDEAIFDEKLVLLGEDAVPFDDPQASKAYLIDGPSWVNNHAHVLRARSEAIIAELLVELLNRVDYSQHATFGTRSKLTQEAMRRIRLEVPPVAEQRRIVDLITAIDEAISAAASVADRGREARSALLANLLSGEHEIPESYDRLLEGVS